MLQRREDACVMAALSAFSKLGRAAQYFREAHRVPLNPALAAGCCGKAQPMLATSAQFKRSNVLGFQWCQRHVLFPLVKF